MPASKAQAALTAERRSKAIQLRVAGVDWETIAKQLGYASRGAAHCDVTRALRQRQKDLNVQAGVAAALEVERLETMERAAWAVLRRNHFVTTQAGRLARDDNDQPLADDGPTLQAIDRLLKIQDRRARLLGLDAPTKVEVITDDALDREIARLNQELAANDPAPVVD